MLKTSNCHTEFYMQWKYKIYCKGNPKDCSLDKGRIICKARDVEVNEEQQEM